MRYDVLLKGGNVFDQGLHIMPGTDIGILDGRIVEMGKRLDNFDAKEVVDITGKMVFPGLVDSALYPDTAFLTPENVSTSPQMAWKQYLDIRRQAEGMSGEELYQDLYGRGQRLFEKASRAGTTMAKAHVMVGDAWGYESLRALLALKKTWKGRLDIYTVVSALPGREEELEKAIIDGAVDIIGVDGDLQENFQTAVDRVFELAVKYSLPICIACGESNDPQPELLLYISQKVFTYHYFDKVSVEGMSTLSADGIDRDEAVIAMGWAAKVRLGICSHTTQSNQLLDWRHRATAPIRALHDAGAFVTLGSGHVRDVFNPFGDADLMSEVLYSAHVHKYGTMAGYVQLMEMITTEAAYSLGIADTYGMLPGRKADLVVFDSSNVTDTVLSKAKRLLVMKDGRIIWKFF